ncbi:MAG: PEP-CTERM sorting domain-containing protein, partial [Bryobacterales bacterium]|nr:PEP-CTERM sorting domain-containing protein [Bryobacterales bacterium]
EVTNVTISGYGFDVGWQPGLLELTSITPANIFAPLTTIQFFPSTPDASGLASGLAESVAGPGSFTGSGSLMTLAFKGLANGNTSIELSNLLLLDEFGDPFNIEIGTAEVTVGAIPEPGTGVLMSCVLGVAAIGWLRRKR